MEKNYVSIEAKEPFVALSWSVGGSAAQGLNRSHSEITEDRAKAAFQKDFRRIIVYVIRFSPRGDPHHHHHEWTSDRTYSHMYMMKERIAFAMVNRAFHLFIHFIP